MASDHGTFCWHDIWTPSKEQSLKFWHDAFGWTSEPVPIGDGTTYTMVKDAHGQYMGGMMESKDCPRVLSYILVANVDDSLKHAVGKGAKAHGHAVNVGVHGRMATLEDPFGAVFCLWQNPEKKAEEAPKETAHESPTKKGKGKKKEEEKKKVPHTALWVWHETLSDNGEDSAAWYCEVFGWETKASAMGPDMTYHLMKVKGAAMDHAGAMTKPMKDMPTSWTAYIGTDNVDAQLAKAKEHGAKVITEAKDIPDNKGRFAIFAEPTGPVVALFQAPKSAGAGHGEEEAASSQGKGKKRKAASKAKGTPKKKRAKKDDDEEEYAPGGSGSDKD